MTVAVLWWLSKKRESARMGANGADGTDGPDGADGAIGTNATDRRRRRIMTRKDRTNTPTMAMIHDDTTRQWWRNPISRGPRS